MAGLLVTGLMLQWSMGPIDWDLLAWPANLVGLAFFLLLLVAARLMRSRCYFFRFMTTSEAAVPAIAAAVMLTLVMGLTPQVKAASPPSDTLGLTKMLSFWPFVLTYIWMTAILGEVILQQIFHSFCWHRLPSLLSHVGLFVALVCGTLGSADIERLRMYCEQGSPEWRGIDERGQVHELPVAIQLGKFSIDVYPPELMIARNDGKPLPMKKPQFLSVDSDVTSGKLLDWQITIERRLDQALPAGLTRRLMDQPAANHKVYIRPDSLGHRSLGNDYVPSSERGAECALLVRAASTTSGAQTAGWVTCGSYRFPPQGLSLSDSLTLVMGQREPRRYSSLVDVYTQDGKSLRAEITVNHPLNVDGWKIYQYSYDERMGRWSQASVFELVKDPWLPLVYIGIALLAVGAVGLLRVKS